MDEALRKADQKAQTEAWGSALRRGQNTGSREDEGGDGVEMLEILVWRARGLGFWVSATVSWGVGLACKSDYGMEGDYLTDAAGVAVPERALNLIDNAYSAGMGLLFLHLVSVLWFAWDPYWLRRRREHHRGRVKGRGSWIVRVQN